MDMSDGSCSRNASNRRLGQLPQSYYRLAYSLLADVTPLPGDCGELCGRACCSSVEEHAGMYLFPGEERVFRGDPEWVVLERHPVTEQGFCPDWLGRIDAVTLVRCKGSCPRGARPLACRLFPLAPTLKPAVDGKAGIRIVLNPDAVLVCPLARYGRLGQLDPRFRAACRRVFRLLAADPMILADFRWRNARWREEGGEAWRKLLDP